MIWTADPEAVTGEQLLSFVPASRISLDPIAAAARVGRGVEADAVVVLPGDAGLVLQLLRGRGGDDDAGGESNTPKRCDTSISPTTSGFSNIGQHAGIR